MAPSKICMAAAILLVFAVCAAQADASPASRRYGPATTSPRAELMRNEVPCAQIRAFNTDSCKDVCGCVAEKAHASNGREALCVSVCNKCARAGRGCTEGGTQKLSGICLKVIQNQMVQECVASYTGDRE